MTVECAICGEDTTDFFCDECLDLLAADDGSLDTDDDALSPVDEEGEDFTDAA